MKTGKDKALALIKNKKIACIGSVSIDRPFVKAVLVAKREGLSTFYFASNTSSARAAQYRENPNACVYFYNRIIYKGVHLTGKMEVLTDDASRNALWKPSYRFIYKGGVSDPDYCVLKFTAESGKYYANLRPEDFSI